MTHTEFFSFEEVHHAFLSEDVDYLTAIDVLVSQFNMHPEDAEMEVQQWEDEVK